MKIVKKILLALLISTMSILFLFNRLSSQQTSGELFEKALYMEEAKGDLQKAIDLYKEILEKFSENREVAAKSQLHIGLCYEKLGLKEAPKAYQKVVDEYPEQKEAVKIAKEKLSVLSRAKTFVGRGDKEFKIRQVWADAIIGVARSGALGAISPDGRYISHLDWSGNLAIREIETGKQRNLTHEGSWESDFALYSRWSPNGKQIAYDWYKEDGATEIRIIKIDGSKPRILYRTDKKKEVIQTYDWSPDNKHILALLTQRNDETNQIVSISIKDGSIRVLKTFAKKGIENSPTMMSYSPDGSYIVYDYTSKEGSANRDVFLLSVDGSQEIPIIDHPADDFVLGWAPDGKNLVFASDRTGALSVWTLNIDEGKPHGSPQMIKSDIGIISPVGITQKGSLYFIVSADQRNIYIAEVDPDTGRILTPPKIFIKRFEGFNRRPSYSPDGNYLAYISVRSPFSLSRAGQSRGQRVLCIHSLETGMDREIPTKLNIDGPPRWSPDGKYILVRASYKKEPPRWGLYKIDVQTSDIKPIVLGEDIHISYEWSHDGKSAFYVRNQRKNNLCQIMVGDIESGKEKELYRESSPVRFAISLSPDGQWLAFINNISTKRALRVIPTAGGESRELYSWDEIGAYIWITWSPDGKYILFPKRPPINWIELAADLGNLKSSKMEKYKWSLWRIPSEGGEAQKLNLEMVSFSSPTAHPDGRYIAFTSIGSTFDMRGGLWVMENFLPQEKTNE